MKATFAVLFVATLLLVSMASAAAVAATAGSEQDAPATAAAAPASVAPAGAAAAPQPPAASANPASAQAAQDPWGTPAAEWLFACVPQCSYYQGICQEECSGLGGIKSFSCTPPPPGLCAHFTCVCNKGL
jgi:hypothetical protein